MAVDYSNVSTFDDLCEAETAAMIVEAQLRRELTSTELDYVPTMVQDVVQQVRSISWQFEADFSRSERFRMLVGGAVGRAVARVIRAGDSPYARESVGDYSYAFDSSMATGALKLLPEDRDALVGLSTGWAVSGGLRRAYGSPDCAICSKAV